MNLKGIQFRLLLLGVFPPFLLVIILALYFIQYHYIDLENALKEKGQISINQLAISSIYGVFYGNSENLDGIAKAFLSEPDIASVRILNSLGMTLAYSEQKSLPPINELIYFQHPVTISNFKQKEANPGVSFFDDSSNKPAKTIGTVRIALSLVNTHKKQITYLFNSFLLICFGVIFTILIAIRLSKKISTPIINLTRAVNKLANDHMNTQVTGSSISEIDELCQRFNTMAIGLQQTQNHLIYQENSAVKELNERLVSLDKKNKYLEKTTQLAIAQNKTKSQFLAHISHEIRTPMNGILGFIELLTKSKLSLQQLDRAQLIKISATSLLTIVNEILDYSSLETGNFNIERSTFNLRENIENCVTLISTASDKVQIIIDIDNNIPNLISTDPIRLQQIVTNLLGNACKFTHQGHILIRCRILEPNSLFISISDTGRGIHKNKIPDLFLPFLQTSEYAVNHVLGTGLGLTISKNIIERLDGTIGVCSKHNTGSTFWINLPVSGTEPKKADFKQETIVVIDSFSLRKKAFIKQLVYLGYKPQSFCTIDELDSQQKTSCDLLFHAVTNEIYDLKGIPEHIRVLTNDSIIFIHPHNQPSPSKNFLSLPCRSSYLKNIIKKFTESKHRITHSSQIHSPKTVDSFSIFIADDNEINRLLLKSQLKTHCNNITLAEEGKTALSYLQKNKYDLILLDLQMPYLSGLELIKIIKQPNSINKGSPVVAITAHAQSHQRKTLIEAGFDECLIKPILMEQLKEILDLWLPETNSSLKNNSDIFDYVSTLLNKTSGNTKLASTLFDKLFIELQEQSLEIEQALEANDLALAEGITHKLHGSVSFCGFTDIQAIARALEISLSENDSQLIRQNFHQLKNKIIDFIKLKEMILAQL